MVSTGDMEPSQVVTNLRQALNAIDGLSNERASLEQVSFFIHASNLHYAILAWALTAALPIESQRIAVRRSSVQTSNDRTTEFARAHLRAWSGIRGSTTSNQRNLSWHEGQNAKVCTWAWTNISSGQDTVAMACSTVA